MQLVDAGCEQRDLNFRRARVVGFPTELIDELSLALLGDRHLVPHRLRTSELLLYATVHWILRDLSILSRQQGIARGETESRARSRRAAGLVPAARIGLT